MIYGWMICFFSCSHPNENLDVFEENGEGIFVADKEVSEQHEASTEGEMEGEIEELTEDVEESSFDGVAFANYANDHWDDLKVRSLAAIQAGTDCAAFVSVALQDFGFDVHAVYTDGLGVGDLPEQTLAYRLFELGFVRSDNAQELQAGDICFTQDGHYEGILAIECDYPVSQDDGYFPTHSYIFMEWDVEGSTDWAWVVDNQGQKHLRNMTISGPKDMFQYFVRYQGEL